VPLRIRSDPAGIHIGPGCTFSHYPIRGGRVLNYDAFAVVDGWTEEGWTVRSSIDEIKGQFSDFNADILELIKQTPPENLFKWGLFDRDVQTRWSVDSVTLLGDAAHPMLPFLGQGSGIAIEDAVVLARLLSEGGDLVEALARYERARFPRAEFATLTGRKHAQVYSTHPDLRDERDLEVSIDLNDYDASTVPI
jgi:salicylate hydroxylase